MATVRQYLLPEEAQYLATAFPQYVKANGANFPISGLAFDAATDEAAFWKFRADDYGSGNLTLEGDWYADTASTGNIVFEAQLAVITPNTDTQDVEAKAFATLNFVQDTHLGTTAQRLHRFALTITNLDSLANGDWAMLRFARDANGTNATDDMAGDGIVCNLQLSYSDT